MASEIIMQFEGIRQNLIEQMTDWIRGRTNVIHLLKTMANDIDRRSKISIATRIVKNIVAIVGAILAVFFENGSTKKQVGKSMSKAAQWMGKVEKCVKESINRKEFKEEFEKDEKRTKSLIRLKKQYAQFLRKVSKILNEIDEQQSLDLFVSMKSRITENKYVGKSLRKNQLGILLRKKESSDLRLIAMQCLPAFGKELHGLLRRAGTKRKPVKRLGQHKQKPGHREGDISLIWKGISCTLQVLPSVYELGNQLHSSLTEDPSNSVGNVIRRLTKDLEEECQKEEAILTELLKIQNISSTMYTFDGILNVIERSERFQWSVYRETEPHHIGIVLKFDGLPLYTLKNVPSSNGQTSKRIICPGSEDAVTLPDIQELCFFDETTVNIGVSLIVDWLNLEVNPLDLRADLMECLKVAWRKNSQFNFGALWGVVEDINNGLDQREQMINAREVVLQLRSNV